MSSFLAPIHFWLYNKISLQEELIRDLAGAAKSKGLIADEKPYVSEPLPDLGSAIDLGNIHGWLQDKISAGERRLAMLASDIIKKDEKSFFLIEETACSFGKRHPVPEQADAQDAHKALNDSLVNGMPCDTVEKVLESSPEKAAWKTVSDVHAGFWTAQGADPSYYWKLRSAVIRGMLHSSPLLEFTEKGGGVFEIKRR